MNPKKLLYLLAVLFAAFVITLPSLALADDPAPPVVKHTTWGQIKALYRGSSEQVPEASQNGLLKPGVQPSAIVYPGWYKELPVQWLPQVPPGDWTNTRNCGQASALMINAYFNWYCPSSSGITNANRWLASRFGDPRYNDPNGWYTNFSGRNELGTLIVEYFRKAYFVRYGSSFDDISKILAEIQNGKPVIVGVMIYGGRLVSSGGRAHWALAVGYDQGTGELILNDPGTNSGNKIHYKFATFDASWRTQGRIFVPVW